MTEADKLVNLAAQIGSALAAKLAEHEAEVAKIKAASAPVVPLATVPATAK